MDMNLRKLQEIVKDREARHAAVPGLTKSWTWLSNWTTTLSVLLSKYAATSHVPSVQFSHSVMSNSFWPYGLQHARPPCPSPTPRVYSNSCPSSWWFHPTISFSVVPFSSRLQSFPASGSFPMSQFFASLKYCMPKTKSLLSPLNCVCSSSIIDNISAIQNSLISTNPFLIGFL